jgi:ABC-2 type transport system ATP-binding protein
VNALPPIATVVPHALEMPAALAVEGVSHAFGGRTVLDGVSLAVPQGRFCVLLGPNGAGKTTLFSLVTRLYDTRAGSIAVLGSRVDRSPSAALRRLGVVFQARTLDLDLSVRENLLYHASLHGIGAREARVRMHRALADVDLADRVRDTARKLSGGQMRRVEIARALMHEPLFLLLDEPTVGLDVASKTVILAHVRRLVRERGVGVLWATHLLDEVEDTDIVTVLHRGRVLASGTAPEIVARSGTADLRAAFTALTGDAE